MTAPKSISEITIEDLKRHRWCYFPVDDDEYNSFEHVIPNTHPLFDENVIELELATFQFSVGQECFGMYDGSKTFAVRLNDEWLYFWSGVRKPTATEVQHTKVALKNSGLALPVTATAVWSGATQVYGGLRYFDNQYNEVEIKI